MIVATLMLVGACSSGDDDSESATGTTAATSSTATTEFEPEATTTTTFATVEDEIAARYGAFWEARLAANSPPNPDDPALPEYATGEQLANVLAETQANLADGVAFRPAERPADIQRVDVVEVANDRAVVQECVVSDGVVYRTGSGEVIDNRVSTYNVRGEMQRIDGAWRLAKATQLQHWDGVAGCALAR